MDTAEIAQRVIACLNAEGVNCMVVDSFSTNLYCVPRGTLDASN
jgi:hypothetical protein